MATAQETGKSFWKQWGKLGRNDGRYLEGDVFTRAELLPASVNRPWRGNRSVLCGCPLKIKACRCFWMPFRLFAGAYDVPAITERLDPRKKWFAIPRQRTFAPWLLNDYRPLRGEIDYFGLFRHSFRRSYVLNEQRHKGAYWPLIADACQHRRRTVVYPAISGLLSAQETGTGDTLCDDKALVILDLWSSPIPSSTRPSTEDHGRSGKNDHARLNFLRRPNSGCVPIRNRQILIAGMGELH